MAGEALVSRSRAIGSHALPRLARARLLAFVALALFGALHWATLVSPGAGGALVATVAIAAVAGGVLIGAADSSRSVRIAAVVGVALGVTAAALLAAGVPVRMLGPRAWDDLAAGLGQGISAMPSVTIPYRGSEAWTRTAILVGGPLLLGVAALLAFWPRAGRGRHLLAGVALTLLYGIAIVQRNPAHPFFDGAIFCLLLAVFLWIESLRSDQLALATSSAVAATLVGALIAPSLDGARPWLDYQEIAKQLEPAIGTTFNWDHRYGRLDWPRDGRELLRIKARDIAYWKAENLDAFDGTRWHASGRLDPDRPDVPGELNPDWSQRIRVINRGLGGTQLVGAGTTLAIGVGPERRESSPGVFEALGRPLRRGVSYDALVYIPRPSEDQLRRAGTDYGGVAPSYRDLDVAVAPDRTVQLSGSDVTIPAPPRLTVRFAPFGAAQPPAVLWREEPVLDPDLATLRDSPYAKVYDLAQNLSAQARTPREYVQLAVQSVQQGATYSEEVASGPDPLVRFLFDDRRGYCQHFSGAMALLLRMSGIPARVATGFSPGRYDRAHKEFVVRDTDAHSWVEAYFPGYGWVTFDPTPGASPARAQQADPGGTASSGAPPPRPGGERGVVPGERPDTTGVPTVQAPATAEGANWTLIGLGIGLGALALTAGAVVVRRGRLPGPPLAPELAELQRALHRSGHTPAPATTLTILERSLGGADAAGGYLRTLRDRRFGTAGADDGPSPAQRRALRRELAAEISPLGRVRSWWALPPGLGSRLCGRLGRRYPGR